MILKIANNLADQWLKTKECLRCTIALHSLNFH